MHTNNAAPYCYSAYGLRIRSFLALPELAEAAPEVRRPERRPDVVIHRGDVDPLPPAQERTGDRWHATPAHVAFDYPGIARYLVRGGTEIVVQPAPGVEEQTLRLFLLGACFGAMLHQRGLLVLHASAVSVRGHVLAFMGHKGFGKSTTAAALHMRGHPLIADDMLAIQLEGTEARVYPGFPQIKLWPDAAAASLDVDPETLTRLHPQLEKRLSRAELSCPHEPMPLRAIYVLGHAERIGVETMTLQEAFVELIRYSFLAKLLADTRSARPHFEQCTRLTQCVEVLRLNRPRDLSLLAEFVRFVERQVETGVPQI